MTIPIELKTERLVLRRFREDDVDDALEYRNDAEFVRFLPHIPHPFTRNDAEKFVTLNLTEDWRTSPTFGVVLENKLIGTVNFEVDARNRSAMVGYAIGRRWWGRGLASEAVAAAISWAQQEFALHRIWASTDPRNEKSQRVLEKLGFKREGVRPALLSNRDRTQFDELVFGLECHA